MRVKHCIRPSAAGVGALAALVFLIGGAFEASASCGSASCFLVTGSEAGVQPKGKLVVDLRYMYVPSNAPDGGLSGRVAAVDQERRRVILDEHQEHRTITETTILDVNYGLTDRVTLELTVPYRKIKHSHVIEVGEANGGAGDFESFQDTGLGDVRLTGKYSVLPTLRSLLVFGLGVDLPTGDSHANNIERKLQEPTLQLGRRTWGTVASIYQSYEVIPHRLNQFASASYRHSFTGSNSYRFGDEYILTGGMNLKTLNVVTLTGQFNWRYIVHDEFAGDLRRSLFPGDAGFPGDPEVIDPVLKRRPVPNTGSTMLAFSPGVSIAVTERASVYFHAQVPIARDFNGGVQQEISFLGGLTMALN
ncbi:MAG: transporter [Nitrospirota bacterium]